MVSVLLTFFCHIYIYTSVYILKTYTIAMLVYHLRQEIGDGVENGGLNQGRCQGGWRHPGCYSIVSPVLSRSTVLHRGRC